ncbi:MAG TPA: ATP-binding protein [Anaerolineae bacterium]|nr:ATP-binding protein [Anaerolineae bacterium]
MILLSIKRIASHAWRRLGAAPVAIKIVGLVVLPLLLVLVAGALFVRQRLLILLAAPEHHSANFDLVFTLTREGSAVLVLGALIGLGLAVLLTWVLVRPLRNLVHAMRRVQAGDLSVEVSAWAHDEIGEVQAEFNAMVAGLRESREALMRQQGELEALNHENTRLLAELHAKSERLQQLLNHALSAQEAERRRLSRELHDETGQALTSILVQLKALQDETDLDLIQDRLNGLRYLTGQTLEEVRRLSMDLRPAVLDDLGLIPAIRWCVKECAEQKGTEVNFNTTDSLGRLPSEVEIVLYRAVQEGLTNIVRHAQAQRAEINLARGPRAVWLTIIDDGRGFESNDRNGKGLGLAGMQERVALIGGRLQVDSEAGGGTRIFIEIPLEEAQRE